MASIQKIEGKMGVSYKITVSQGEDARGKKIRHFKTWKPDHPMTARQTEKEVQRVAFEFEREIELGYQADNRQTFEQYANYFIEMQEQNGCAANTLEMYHLLMKRLVPAIGHMKLRDIRPQHISNLNRELAKAGVRRELPRAQAKVDIRTMMYEKFRNYQEFSDASNVSKSVLCDCCQGRTVSFDTAEKIAAALGKDVHKLFETIQPTAPLAGNTLSKYHSFVSSVLRQAEREMLIPYNPASKVTPPKIEKKEPNYFQPAEIQAILEALEHEDLRWKTMIHLLIVTGCRKGEILGLKWAKVDLDNRQILIDSSISYICHKGIVEGKTKTRRARYVSVPAETAALLRKYRIYQLETRIGNGGRWQDEDFVFTTNTGSPVVPSTLGSWLNAFSRRHGLPHINAHAFRHTAASIMISEGVDIVTVSKMLGHANTSITTDVYSHAIEESKRKATECIADVILRKKKA